MENKKLDIDLISKKVNHLLKSHGMSQHEFSHFTGVNASHVSRLINGTYVNKAIVEKIANSFQLDLSFLTNNDNFDIDKSIDLDLYQACLDTLVKFLKEEKLIINSCEKITSLTNSLFFAVQNQSINLEQSGKGFLLGITNNALKFGLLKKAS